MPKYKWQASKESPVKRLQRLNQHREKMLESVNCPSSSILEETIKEWNILLEERDKTLRKVVDKENQIIFNQHMEKLLNLLQIIGKLDHKNSSSSLRIALCLINQEVKSYLSDNSEKLGVHTPQNTSSHTCDLDMSNSTPNTSWMDNNKHCAHESTDGGRVYKTVKQSSGSVYPRRRGQFMHRESPLVSEESNSTGGDAAGYKKTPTGMLNLHQPRTVDHHSDAAYRQNRTHGQTPQLSSYPSRSDSDEQVEEDLRCSLLKGKENLKSTPGISRSPGGTPQRTARSFNLSDAGDFVAFALKKKFLNIRKLYGSPHNLHDESRDEDTNISID